MDYAQKYHERIDLLRQRKIEQTQQKIQAEGFQNEDDYGRVLPPDNRNWSIIPNHEDGSFYGLEGWTQNFCALMEQHPSYVDPYDAFAGRWMYFLSRMRPNRWNPAYPYDHLEQDIRRYNIDPGIGADAHFAPDFTIGLELGWGGLLKKIAHYRHCHGSEKQAFYDAHERTIKAIQNWMRHTISDIEQKEREQQDPELQQNLRDMAEVNKNILEDPPHTFREACQWMIWFHLASRTFNRDGAGGQLDELLRPYYEKDMDEGRLDDESAIYYLACFLLNDPAYWQVSGPDEAGNDLTSRVSDLILEAANLLNSSLNLTIRVHDGLDQNFFLKSVEYLVKNQNGWPRYSGDNALVKGFTRNGFSAELARKRIAVGCNWMALPGLEYTLNDCVKVNTAKVFEVAFQEMLEDQKRSPSLDVLWEIFQTHLAQAVNVTADCIRFHLEYQRYNEIELVLNLLCHGPLEKGLDMSAGGARYYNLGIDGAGLATVADSFAALEQRLEIEHRLSWEEIDSQLASNWSGKDGERMRLLMKHSDRYGQGNSLGDKWATRISETFTRCVLAQSQPEANQRFIPGWFSWARTLQYGKNVGATPDGRHQGDPISHGANPNPGFTQKGAATSMSTAIASIQPGYGNPAPMQLELDPFIANMDHLPIIAALIKTHFTLGGTLLNINIVNKQKILEAHKDPSKYPDLVVRVTGFTAYFAMLSPEFRQLVVDRVLES